MTLANYPVWPFEPNWRSTLTETLEWLTDIMTSPVGAEQRRSIRTRPRRLYEFSAVFDGLERAYFDNLMSASSGDRLYFPLWHDDHGLTEDYVSGESVLAIGPTAGSDFVEGGAALIVGEAFDHHELVEIATISSNTLTLAAPLTSSWMQNSRIYPVVIGKFGEQPTAKKLNDQLVTAEIRFQALGLSPEIEDTTGSMDVYRDFIVLTERPDERTNLDVGLERMLVEMDNRQSDPVWKDTASTSFHLQQFAWVLQGRSQYRALVSLFHHLRGRALPLWVPTFMSDFELRSGVMAGATTLSVRNAGYSATGGPRIERQDIVIETTAARFYRRVIGANVGPAGETLTLDAPIDADIEIEDVVSISFMALMRSNQDNIQIEHLTDVEGVATALVTFRSAPDLRNVGGL